MNDLEIETILTQLSIVHLRIGRGIRPTKDGQLAIEVAKKSLEKLTETMNEEELRNHFEQNMLDGNIIQKGQMLASSEVFEYIVELLAVHGGVYSSNKLRDRK